MLRTEEQKTGLGKGPHFKHTKVWFESIAVI